MKIQKKIHVMYFIGWRENERLGQSVWSNDHLYGLIWSIKCFAKI